MNYSDPVVDEIHQIRQHLLEQFGHDPVRLIAYYRELQKQLPNPVIKTVEAEPDQDPSAA